MRQYIGARYVPKFMGDYDATTAYEALSVVDNGMGTSYISKIPTPAGTPLTDTTYWTQYGSASGAIIHLQDQIDIINNTDLPAINSDISDLQTEVVKSARKSPSDRHVVILGDSYADTSPTDFAFIIRNSGIFKTVDLVVGGGWGFTGKEGAPDGLTGPELEWLTHFTTFVNGKTADYLADIDDVYIVGGFNDHYSSYNVILSHMSDFFDYAHTALPHAKFHLILCAWAGIGTVTTPNEVTTGAELRLKISTTVLSAYAQAANYGCEFMGHIIDTMHTYTEDFDSSLYHPSVSSEQKIATRVLNLMCDGSYCDVGTTIALNWVCNGSNHNIMNARLCNDKIEIYGKGGGATTIQTTSTYSAPFYYSETDIDINGASSVNIIGGRYGGNMVMIPVQINNATQSKRTFGHIYVGNDEKVYLVTDYTVAANDVCSFGIISTFLPLLDT